MSRKGWVKAVMAELSPLSAWQAAIEFFRKKLFMADWFKLHENWFHEPRLQWAIKENANVIQTWLWVLTECCRTKSDKVGLHSEDYEMLGIQQLLNISPGIFNLCLKNLQKIKYIEIDDNQKTIKVLKWNDFQSNYLTKKSKTLSDNVGQDETLSDNVTVEERRGEEIRKEEIKEPAASERVLNFKHRLGSLYRRRESTPWDKKELKALAAVISRPDSDSELIKIVDYYERRGRTPDGKWLKQSVSVLLNNWGDQLDKAAVWVDSRPSGSNGGAI